MTRQEKHEKALTPERQERTAGPWRQSGLDPYVIGATRILRMRGSDADVPQMQAVCRVMERAQESSANAAFIVRACNAWDDITALQERIAELKASK